jgi:Cytochrome P460
MHTLLKYLVATAACTLVATGASAQSGSSPSVAMVDDKASPIFGVKIPPGYRRWELIAPSQETGTLDELRGILGNGLAMKAYRAETLPFPDGAIIVKLAWKHVQSTEFPAAFVPGAPMTVQVMVKDSKRYTSTGGWGFGRFLDGKPVDEAQHRTCFACHAANVKGHDFVFTRYAP